MAIFRIILVKISYFVCFLVIFLIAFPSFSQTVKADTVFFLANKKGLLGKIGKSVSVNQIPDVLPDNGASKNEEEFLPFKGKIIRKILIQKIGFNKSIYDTANNKKTFLTNLGDALHTSTRKQVIRNNLFFAEGDSLYPNLLADNDKFLRDLSFLQDAKILVSDAYVNADSVDIIIVSKDVFPIGGSLSEATTEMAIFELNDDNLFGSGDRIQIQNLFDSRRNPNFGFGAEYRKRNIAGTFINLTLGYNNQNPSFNTGRREEQSVYIKGELPLVSPYHSITGAFELSRNSTANRYVNDSIYQKFDQYSYSNLDAWLGFSIGARSQLKYNFLTRKKELISFRLLNRDFNKVPTITSTNYDSRYTDLRGVLSSFTVFQQDFYHTNFIYGFGRNEDIPEGFNLSFTGGWTNQNDFSRLYLGVDYQRSYFGNNSKYLNYNIKLGGYYNKNRLEDINFLASVEAFTKLRKLGNSTWYLRHFFSGSFTQQINTFLNDPLRLSSIYGLPVSRNPSTISSGRVTVNMESVFYNTWSLAGFRFAPFGFANFSYLKTSGGELFNGDFYSAIGAGVRTRNENLVFGTMELKAFYFPRTIDNMKQWNITFTTDLKFRYITQLVRKPDVVQVN
jgi:hypothetical protein